MTFENLALGKEALSQGASTGEAKLAGLPGTGTLQVWRSQSEDVISSYQRGTEADAAYCFVNFVPIHQEEVTG